MRTAKCRSKAALKEGNRDQGIQITPKLDNESLNNRKLTIILLTTTAALLKLIITIEEEHIEGNLKLPFHKY